MTPIFSIIIPCYNQADFLEDTLTSVFRQTFEAWECLIIDDGSLDNTAEIAKKWKKKDARFILFQKENGGLSSARNYGLSRARGKYIQFLDSDDILLDSKLANCHQQHTKGTDIVVTSFKHITSNQISPPFCVLKQEYLNFENILLKWDAEFSIPIHCGSFNARIVSDVRFNEELKGGEDWVFWLNVFEKHPTTFFIDDSLVLYRLHNKSLTKNTPLMIEHKAKAQKFIFNSLNENYKQLFFERFSIEAITRREELFNIYRKKKNKLKYKLKAFFKRLTK